MRNLLLILVPALLMFACENDKQPSIERTKFINVLIDLSTDEALYAKLYDRDTNAIRTLAIRNARVLERHHIKKEDFEQSYNYYVRHKPEYVKLLQEAVDSVEARRDRLKGFTK